MDTIRTQTDFDNLLKRASARHEINAYLEEGIYLVKESQPISAEFNLKGNGATIAQKNRTFSKKDALKKTRTHYICRAEDINEFSLFADGGGNIIPVSEDVDPQTKVNIVTEDIVRNDDDTARYIAHIKIRIPKRLSHLRGRVFDKVFGYIDSWFTSPSFTVSHSDSIYFYCDLTQKRESKQYDAYINGEKHQYHKDIPFVIYNVGPESGRVFFNKEYIYIPNEYEKVEVIEPDSKPLFIIGDDVNVKVDGINFVNCSSVFRAGKNTRSLVLTNCTFHNIYRRAFDSGYRTNLKALDISGCRFSNYGFLDHIPFINVSAPECIGIISDCIFNQYESGVCFYKNTSQNIYITDCKEFEIADNLFLNNPAGAMFLLNGKIDAVSNEFFNDTIFNSHPSRNFSRDAGAIYCSKLYTDAEARIRDDNPNKIQLRLNKIHDFYGKGDVRGIFIDDGRGDVTCYGNLIFNGQLYSIDSRVSKVDPYSSIRNKYEYNIVTYPYRMIYGDSISIKDRPVLQNNIQLYKSKNKVTTPSTTDIRTTDFEINGDEVMIDQDIWVKLPADIRKMVKPMKKSKGHKISGLSGLILIIFAGIILKFCISFFFRNRKKISW